MSDGHAAIAGRYRLDELLGRGSMSEVWCAHDLELERTVALKLLAPTADVERFRREARAVASLGHENVTQVFDYGEEGGRPYMVLEYLPGGTLDERLRETGPLDAQAAAAVASGIAAGLAHAHAHGVVHRDLKPANVLFDADGRAKIADFGIARMTAGEGSLTEAGTVLGTAAYISPEQAAGEAAVPASDVYALGAILYRMLTGRLPFEADEPLALAELHRSAPPPGAESLPAGTPPALAALVASTLAKDAAARPQDGGELLAALHAANGPDPEATQVLPAARAGRPPPRLGRTALLTAALGVLATAGGALAWVVTRPSPDAGLLSNGHATTRLEGVTLPRQSTPGPTTATLAVVTPAAPTTTAARPTTHAATTTAATRSTTTAAATTTAPPTTTEAPPTAATTPTTTQATTTAPGDTETRTTAGGSTTSAPTTAP
ncbi:MAG TPA: serine/threonine-protein kinase [Gaiellaceae bacterium]|nr:serine/threonine-protein kinase [Gaiellaceae bacterium]